MSNFSISLIVSAFFSWFFAETPNVHVEQALTNAEVEIAVVDTPIQDLRKPTLFVPTFGDTSKIKSNPNNRRGDPTTQDYTSPLFLSNPSNIKYDFELTEDGQGYNVYERVGSVNIRRPSYISFDQYLDYRRERGMAEYFKEQGLASNSGVQPGLIPTFDLGTVSDIFGGGTVSIKPTGYATLEFAIQRNVNKNGNLPIRQQRQTTFNFDQQIQLGVIGQIGNLLNLNATFDTQATFDFENELKLKWEGSEDQILQLVEAGNVSLQLGNSLIQGRQNLFGIKTRFRFGPVYVTAIGSTERGEVETVRVQSGGEVETPFEKKASDYDLNRHFFLSHFFRSRYEAALANLPIINSDIRINRIEVWAERGGSSRDNRNGLGFTDIGETEASRVNAVGDRETGIIFNDGLVTDRASQPFPNNNANSLFELLTGNPAFRDYTSAPQALQAAGFQNTLDFEIAGNMRKLSASEYTVNNQLGYISLNSAIPTDQVLFVAFEYTINGQLFQVGEFSQDVTSDGLNSNALFLKMLKSSVLRPTALDPVTQREVLFPPWDLMMKNIYNIGFGIQPDGFFLDIQYESGTSAGKINYIPDGNLENRPFLQVLRLDQLTNNTAPGPDFRFDFIPGLTILPTNGLIVFPVLEPFGSHLAERLDDANDSANFAFQPLYDLTMADAVQQFPHLDRYSLEGFYKGSSNGAANEIPLNTFQLSEGSVTLVQGGRQLQEGVDYEVDQFGGKVRIINPAVLNSPQEIEIQYESASSFNLQTRTLLGARAEYLRSENFTLGATILNLREQPFNRKPVLGEEPINNTLWGLDGSLRTESDFITKLIDKAPLISTKETSSIQASGEFAQFLPGQPAVVKNDNERGFVFLDDFEALENTFSLQGLLRWKLASVPSEEDGVVLNSIQGLPNSGDSLALGYTRAKLAWYQIDPTVYQGIINIPQEDLLSNLTRRIDVQEIFPTARRAFGTNNQFTFDLRFQPQLRGPYNYQASNAKVGADGNFTDPRENWAGIMREIDINNDFEANNVEFLEFWVLDPFIDNPGLNGGDLYINLGLINEDVLPDGGLSRENGLPRDGVADATVRETAWGRVPIAQPPVNAFGNGTGDRENQDVGLDGLSDENERTFFDDFINQLGTVVGQGSPVHQSVIDDPSTDNFQHYRDESFEQAEAGILERYENFNGTERNTPLNSGNENFSFQGSNVPDTEDINDNGSLNFAEQYWEYRVSVRPQDLQPGSNFVVDRIENVNFPVGNSGSTVDATWYQFRIPIASGRAVNGVSNFKSINFMRLYMTGWDEEVILRTTEFQFVSTQWRRFLGNLRDNAQVTEPPEPPFADFEIGTLSIEENSTKVPFPYVLPPDVIQQAINGNTQAGFLQNERALQLLTCNLEDGDARSTFKLVNQDLRQYERLRMWVHAEPLENGGIPSNFNQRGDVEVFLRLGLDNEFNYYEYVLPVDASIPGANTREEIWPNEFNFKLADLSTAKRERDSAGVGVSERFIFEDPAIVNEGEKIIVRGTPKLSDIRNIMIGIRNPRDPGGQPICAEIWVNELRLTDFDQESGWAAQGNISLGLADVATIDANVRHQTQGFGPLEQKITDRPLSETTAFNVRLSFNLDKLFPKNWGLRLPVSADYGERRVTPVFDPQEADVRTDELIRGLDREAKRETLKNIRDFTRTRGVALNGWRKLRVGDNPKTYPWDIENFDLTVAYNEELFTSSVIERRFSTNYRGALNYRYNFQPFNWQPFQEGGENNLLKLLNISPLPTSVAVSLTADRRFEERRLRNQREGGLQIPPTFQKNFLITRNYNLVWNFTRNLQLNFNATNNARVDEVQGYRSEATPFEIDSVGTLRENLLTFGRSRDTVITTFNGEQRIFIRDNPNLINMGRTTNYRHSLNATYTLPFAQFPLTNWINGNASYSATFDWQQAPEINPNFGATITNTQAIQGNARLNLKSLFSKVKPLKKVLDDYDRKGRERQASVRTQRQGPEREEARPMMPVPQQEGKAVKDTTKGPDPFFFLKKIGYEILRLAMSVQNVDFTFSQNAGTVLPGFLPKTDNFGLDFRYSSPFQDLINGRVPPTAGFILGSQRDIRGIAADNGWITQDTTLSNLFLQNKQTQFTGRTSIELFRGFRLELSVQRNKTENNSSFFRYDPRANSGAGGYREIDPFSNGTFSMTYIFLNSAFEKFDPDNSKAFDRFSENRQVISQRRFEESPNTSILSREGIVRGGYQNGFLGNNQSVLIPAFLSAYGIIGPENVTLKSFPKIPLPNWSVNYNGLSNIPFLQEIFTSVTLRHTYRATYSIGGFNNNLGVLVDPITGFVTSLDTFEVDMSGDPLENFQTTDIINNILVREDFAPLLGINMTMKNGVTTSIDYKRGRSLNFSTGTLQLNELRNQDLSVSVGYRQDQLNWKFQFLGKDFDLQNSMNVNFRLTMRDTRELNRNLAFDDGANEPTVPIDYTRGNLNWIISPSVDYVVSNRINVKVFFEQNINRPFVSSAFDTSFASGGFQIRFTLAE